MPVVRVTGVLPQLRTLKLAGALMSYHSFFRKGSILWEEGRGSGQPSNPLSRLCSAGWSFFEIVRHLHFLSLSLLALGQTLVLANRHLPSRGALLRRESQAWRVSWRVVPRVAPARGGYAGALPEPPACYAAARGAAGELGCTGDGGRRHLDGRLPLAQRRGWGRN